MTTATQTPARSVDPALEGLTQTTPPPPWSKPVTLHDPAYDDRHANARPQCRPRARRPHARHAEGDRGRPARLHPRARQGLSRLPVATARRAPEPSHHHLES